MGSLLVSCLMIVLAFILLLFFLLWARSRQDKQRMFKVQPGGLLENERLQMFHWLCEQVPEGYYICPSVRLKDAFFRESEKGLVRFFVAASPLASTVLDAVVVQYQTGAVVAVVQRTGSDRMGLIERTADDAGIPVIEGKPGNHIPWEEIIR